MGKGKGESDNIFSASQSSVFSPLRRLLRRISRLIELEKGERGEDDEEAFVVRKTGPPSLSLPCTYAPSSPLLLGATDLPRRRRRWERKGPCKQGEQASKQSRRD